MLNCALCGSGLVYIHGHAACVQHDCPMKNVNQAECCSGDAGCLPTSAIARIAQPSDGASVEGDDQAPTR